MFKAITNSFLIVSFLLTAAIVSAQSPETIKQPRRLSGCTLLAHPSRYNGQLVEVAGTVNVGFERSDMTFSCSGRLGISFSLYEPDLKKYGFLTAPESKKALDSALGEEHPGEIINDRKTKSVNGTIVGLFRCHYDFPTCEGITRYGDSSIVVKSVKLDSILPRHR